jgi:outer membrane protein OmpA-like peptidoglycan-associated protein
MNTLKILIIFLPLNLLSQNLILNPEFKSASCAQYIGLFNSHALKWSSPTFGSTDLFNTCNIGDTGIPDNFNGNQDALEGNNYVGCYFYSKNNYREYIQGTFSSSLEKDTHYRISLFISLAENSNAALKSIEFLVTKSKIKIATHSELSNNQLNKLKIEYSEVYSIDSKDFYDDTKKWTLISAEIIAKGNENFITIGNFKNNLETEKKQLSSLKEREMSYYYISEVLVEKINKPVYNEEIIPVPSEPETSNLKENKFIEIDKKYVFKNIQFDFNSVILSVLAESELNDLYEVLISNDQFNISIFGHTDNVGDADFNQILSEKRAKIVMQYMIDKGITIDRIKAVGFGNSQPVATNSTAQGRSQNRRVEFKILTQ